MKTQLSRVVREYVLWVGELEHSIKGRVSEVIDDPQDVHYEWEVIHRYKPSASAVAPSIPSVGHPRGICR